MGRAEFVTTEVWEEVENLSWYATLLFFWSWTNSKCNMAGLYRVGRRSMTESKCPRHKLDDALAELQAEEFVYYVDGILWVKSRVKRLAPRARKNSNPLIARSVARDVAKIHADHPLREAFLGKYGKEPWLEPELVKELSPFQGASKGLLRGAEEEEAVDAEVVVLRKSLNER